MFCILHSPRRVGKLYILLHEWDDLLLRIVKIYFREQAEYCKSADTRMQKRKGMMQML